MSGRSLHHQPDGRITIGSRKTDRRNPRRDPRERLQALATEPGSDFYPVRVAFRLPKMIEAFVSPGSHGVGVEVLAHGFVRVGAGSADHAFVKAKELLAAIAKGRPAFTAQAIVISTAHPGQVRARFLTVVSGSMVVSSGLVEPTVYEAA